MTQFVGLNDRAKLLIQGEPVYDHKMTVIREYPNGEEKREEKDIYVSSIKESKGDYKAFGMFEEEIQLSNYTFPDGKVWKEKEQASPWSSGPMIFTALVDENDEWIEDSKWTDEEINQMT
jgi:hypothetical protein